MKSIFTSFSHSGTIEKSSEAEEEVYETVNISKIKAHTPNLRVNFIRKLCFTKIYFDDFRSSICMEYFSSMIIILKRLLLAAFISIA